MASTSDAASAVSTSTFNYYEFRRGRSESPFREVSVLDLSYLDLTDDDANLNELMGTSDQIGYTNTITLSLLVNNNLLKKIPKQLVYFQNIEMLEMSSNQLESLGDEFSGLFNLKVLVLKANLLTDTSLPKNLSQLLPSLEVINLAGNQFDQFPYQLLQMEQLMEINLGSNKISSLPRDYERLKRLAILYLGGNQLKSIPDELCQLQNLTSLNLSGNLIRHLPNNLASLKKLKTLSLHSNNLTTLPVELVKLNLEELSLRGNPLVARFARTYTYNAPTLLELSGRVIKSNQIAYASSHHLPNHLIKYLNSAKCCLNPTCAGVYFQSKFECIKFVDFCGKYRIPLMQYLCSSSCNERVANEDPIDDTDSDSTLLRKIYIG